MRGPLVRSLALGAALALAGTLAAAQTRPFAPTTQLAGQTLQLNGAGTRFRSVVRVYDLALYTPTKVSTPEELLALRGPLRLAFVALRDIPSDQLGRAMVQGMRDNAPAQHSMAFTNHMGTMGRIFSATQTLKTGDSFSMDYVPGKGATFYINGVARGDPVSDPGFMDTLLRIWVGARPADAQLKERLLGRQPAARDMNSPG
ncbi:MAG: chalcone isomerase family protein [Pseudomonadota bacterium]|nr:chalcone isomerase family protein [Pseudomonadota bacterium]